jgi:hypothetical protein
MYHSHSRRHWQPFNRSQIAFLREQTFDLLLLLLLVIIFFGGMALIQFITGQVYSSSVKAIPTGEALIYPTYKEHLATQKDTRHLARSGDVLLNSNMPLYASLNFARASELDPNLRDAAYGWAYALLQAKQDKLSPQDLQDIHTAINRAEAVDPMYIPLLKLKLLVAQIEKNQDVITATQARLKALGQ